MPFARRINRLRGSGRGDHRRILAQPHHEIRIHGVRRNHRRERLRRAEVGLRQTERSADGSVRQRVAAADGHVMVLEKSRTPRESEPRLESM